MKIVSDHFFAVGRSHAKQGIPCEDYALSYESPDRQMAFGIVSDGCGGVSSNTDVGARAMCHAVREILLGGVPPAMDATFADQVSAAFLARQTFSDDPQDYLATGMACWGRPDQAGCWIFGDGAYLVRYRNGRSRLTLIEWDGNAPFYLAYRMSPPILNRWAKGGASDGSNDATMLESWWEAETTAGGLVHVLDRDVTQHNWQDLANGALWSCRPDRDEVESLTIFSDGLTRCKDMEPLDLALALTDYKTLRGGFVKQKALQVVGYGEPYRYWPDDDIALASLVWDDG